MAYHEEPPSYPPRVRRPADLVKGVTMADLLADITAGNRAWADALDPHELVTAPARRAALVTCMDSRIDALAVFGLELGDTHIVRNAGAVVTDDVERSLLLARTRWAPAPSSSPATPTVAC